MANFPESVVKVSRGAVVATKAFSPLSRSCCDDSWQNVKRTNWKTLEVRTARIAPLQ